MIKQMIVASALGFVAGSCNAGETEFNRIISEDVFPSITRTDKQIKISTIEEKEIACLAQNLYHEARNQPVKGIIAIGYVVKTRVKRSRWPNTICEVIWQYKVIKGKKRPQFSWTVDGQSDVPHEKKAWDKAKKIASTVYHNTVDNPVGNSDHYFANYVNPPWAISMYKTATIGDHHFMDSSIKVEVASAR